MEKLLFKKIELWVVGVLCVLFAIGLVGYGMVLENAVVAHESHDKHEKYGWVGDLAMNIADIPNTLKTSLDTEPRRAGGGLRHAQKPAGWSFPGAQPTDISGYMLFSRIDGNIDRSVVELVDLSDFSVLHSWAPDPEVLFEGVERDSNIVPYSQWHNRRFRVMHPLLEANGTLVMHGQFSPLLRLDACGETLWRQDATNYHHSLNVDADGNFWAPSINEPTTVALSQTYRDDTLSAVTSDGEVLFNRSVSELLIANGHEYMVYQNHRFDDDPTHLNDIEPVLADGPFWKKGDLFVSTRRQSMIFLYRPSTDKIIWMKRGPWLSQHDVDIVDDHTIAVFNNNVRNRGRGGYIDDTSNVMFYDFETDEVTSPYQYALMEDPVFATTNGLFDLTESGHMLLEEDTSGRFLIFGPDKKLVAEWINRGENGVPYRMAWTRYVPAELADAAVAAIQASGCAPAY